MNEDNYLYKATIQIDEDGWGHVISEDRRPCLADDYIMPEKDEPHLIQDGYGTLDISKIKVAREEKFLQEISKPLLPTADAIKSEENKISGYKCHNCGCGIIIIHDGKPEEELFCPYCKEKLNQTRGANNEL